MNIGQLLGGAGVVASGMRQAEEAERIAQQNQLAIEQQNRQRAMADEMSRRQIASRTAGLAPPTVGAFTPGQAYGTPEVPAPAAPAPAPGQVALPTGVQPSQAGAGRGMVNPPLIGQPQPVPSAPAAGLQMPPAAPEAASPFGRFMAQERRTLGEQYKRNALYEQVVDKYRLAASPLGVFKAQTDAQREQAKQILSRVNELSADELQYVLDKGELPPAKPTAAAPTPQPAPAAQPMDFSRLAAAVEQVESGGRVDAVSPKGAVGPMQTMPRTLTDPGYGVTPARDNSVDEQRRVGQEYLAAMLGKYNGNLDYALAAYNWGPGNTDRWIAAGADPAKLPKETRDYVPKVKAAMGGAPAAQPVNITPNMAPTKVADAVAAVAKPPAPAKSGTMYGPAAIDATVNNPQIQQVLSQRQALVDQIQLMEQYGFGMQAMELVPQIKAIDLGLYKAQADQGIYEGTTMGNFSRAMQMLSHFRGIPHQVLDRGDRTYDLYVGGQVAQTGLSIETLADLIRSNVDEEYRAQRQQLVAKRAEKADERAAKIDEIIATEMLKSQSNLNVAMINATAELKKQNIINQKAQLQVDSNTGQVILYEGGKITVINPAATEEIRGQTVQRPTAIPVARLP
jgi:soluble lytic murein transglycosylase-like protein